MHCTKPNKDVRINNYYVTLTNIVLHTSVTEIKVYEKPIYTTTYV